MSSTINPLRESKISVRFPLEIQAERLHFLGELRRDLSPAISAQRRRTTDATACGHTTDGNPNRRLEQENPHGPGLEGGTGGGGRFRNTQTLT